MFFTRIFKNICNKWFPQAVTVGKPADTQEIAERISSKTTLTTADVHAVIRALPAEIASIMAEGRSVNFEGLGAFRYSLDTSGKGVDTPEEVSVRQIKGLRVLFRPAKSKRGQSYVSQLIGNVNFIEWVDPKKQSNEI